MAGESIAEQIGRAWRYEREGQPDKSIAEFERILKLDNKNIDAHFGLGMALRAAKRLDDALRSFQTALELVDTAEHTGRGDRGNLAQATAAERIRAKEHDDRHMMLRRMLNQRIAETQAGIQAR